MTGQLFLHASELELLSAFNRFRVRYLVVGGYAVRFHGRTRSVKDLDLFIDSTGDNPSQCLNALHALKFTNSKLSAALAKPKMQIRLDRYYTELLTSCDGPPFEEVFQRRVLTQEHGVEVPVVSREDLLEQKRKLNRPKDIEDVKALEEPTVAS